MINIWPSWVKRAGALIGALVLRAGALGQRARPFVLGAGALVRRARPSVPRARLSTQFLGEIALSGLLLATLAFAPRDGVPSDDAVWPQPGVRLQAAPVQEPLFGLVLPGLARLSGVARSSGASVSAKALIPTAPPVQLLIPTLDVHRAVEAVGANRSGVMNLPVNSWNAGWYQFGPIPGAPGDAVIEGHAGYPDQPMIFGKLATLKRGAQVVVVLGDGSRRLFEVVSMETLNVGVAPAGFGEPYGLPRLTLITCTGHFDPENKYYSKRLAVELRYVGLV